MQHIVEKMKNRLRAIGAQTGTEHLFANIDDVLGNVLDKNVREKKEEEEGEKNAPIGGYVTFINLSNSDLAKFRLIPEDPNDGEKYKLITPDKNGEWEDIDGFYWSEVSNITSKYWFKISFGTHVDVEKVNGKTVFTPYIRQGVRALASLRKKDFGVEWRPKKQGSSDANQHPAMNDAQSENPFVK